MERGTKGQAVASCGDVFPVIAPIIDDLVAVAVSFLLLPSTLRTWSTLLNSRYPRGLSPLPLRVQGSPHCLTSRAVRGT